MKTLLCLITVVSCLPACGLLISEGDTNTQYLSNSLALVEMDQGFEELTLNVYTINSTNSTWDTLIKHFAWLIPLPAMPEFEDANDAIVQSLSQITGPVFRRRIDYGGCYNSESQEEPWGSDYYEVMESELNNHVSRDTVFAESLAVITGWLASRGFNLSTIAANLVEKYIGRGWKYFYIAVYHIPHDWPASNRVGVRLRFASNEPVIPMEIAKANKFTYDYNNNYDAFDHINLYAYAIAEHKQAHAKADLLYANKLNPEEIDNITSDHMALGIKFTSGDYITKLVFSFQSPDQDITSDLIMTDAADDNEYRELYSPDAYYYYMTVDPFLLLVAFYLFKLKWRKRVKS